MKPLNWLAILLALCLLASFVIVACGDDDDDDDDDDSSGDDDDDTGDDDDDDTIDPCEMFGELMNECYIINDKGEFIYCCDFLSNDAYMLCVLDCVETHEECEGFTDCHGNCAVDYSFGAMEDCQMNYEDK